MPGSNLAAYAREALDMDEEVGVFSVPRQISSSEILASEDSNNLDYAMSITDISTERVYSVNPYYAASCHARFIDEALSESDENCRFAIRRGRIVVLATKHIQPGAQLLGRYGQEYWFKRIDYNPYDLSLTMYRKYSTTMKEFECKDWRRALKRKAKGLKQTSPEITTISEDTGNNRTTEPVQVCNNIMFKLLFFSHVYEIKYIIGVVSIRTDTSGQYSKK